MDIGKKGLDNLASQKQIRVNREKRYEEVSYSSKQQVQHGQSS